MNKILYFLAGLGLGGGVGVLATRKIMDKKYDEMLKIEIDELREYYNRTNTTIQLVSEGPSEKKEGKSAQNGPKLAKEDSKITKDEYFRPTNRGKRTNYSSYFDPDDVEIDTNLAFSDPGGPTDDDPEEEEYETELDETERISGGRISRTGIELISAIDYNERNAYEKEEYFYYKKTKTLTDSNDEIVEDYEDVVGTEFEDIIFQGDAGTVYVRNNGFAKDFLITVLNERYDFSRL